MNYLNFLSRQVESVGGESSTIGFLMDADTLKNIGLQFLTPENPEYAAPHVTYGSVESTTFDAPHFANGISIFQNEIDKQLQPGSYTGGSRTTSVKIDLANYNSLFPTALQDKTKFVRLILQFGESARAGNPYA
jgi:hypothetical protein